MKRAFVPFLLWCHSLLVVQRIQMTASLSFRAEWERLNPSSRVNPRRSGLVSFRSKDGVPYVFGGYAEEDLAATDQEEKPAAAASPYISSQYHRYVKNDLWEWNGSDSKWQQVQYKGDVPDTRLAAAAGVIDQKAYLVGGTT